MASVGLTRTRNYVSPRDTCVHNGAEVIVAIYHHRPRSPCGERGVPHRMGSDVVYGFSVDDWRLIIADKRELFVQ